MGDYNEIWFVNTRVQTTNLKRWFLWGILLFLFVTVSSIICVKSMYKPIKTYEIHAEDLAVTVSEAKQTNINGYIKGTVKNEKDVDIAGKYIKFTFYTKDEVEIGKEYIEVGNLKSQETKTYEAKFKYQNVEKFIITISDNKD